MAKYSIILPVHNGGHYLRACVASILSQIFTDFNLLVLENASTDGTAEWLHAHADPRIKVYPSSKLLTIEENWARITSIPKNEYITLIGHDDLLMPSFLADVDQLISSQPGAGVYHTHFNFIDADGHRIRACKPMKDFYDGPSLLKAFLTQEIDSMGTGYVMRAADYDKIGGIPPRYPSLLFADFELWLSLAQHGGMAVGKQQDFSFRVHQSTTGKSSDEKLHQGLSMYTDYLAGLANSNSILADVIKKHGQEMLTFYCKGFAHRLLRSPLANRNNFTVTKFIEFVDELAIKLQVHDQFKPRSVRSIGIAQFIDSNWFSRQAFLVLKRIHRKPLLD